MAPKLPNSQPEELERSCKDLTEKLNGPGQNINNTSDAPTDSDDSDRPLVKRVNVIRQVAISNNLSDNTSNDSDSDTPIVQRVRDKCQVGKRNNPKENNPNNDTDDSDRPIMQSLIVKRQAGKDSSNLNDDSGDADESLMENHARLALVVGTIQRLNKDDGDNDDDDDDNDNDISLAKSIEHRHCSFGLTSKTTKNTQNKISQISSKRADQDNLDKGSSQTPRHAKRIIERDDCDGDIDIIAINPQLTHPGNISSLNIPEKILSIAKPQEGNSKENTNSDANYASRESRLIGNPLITQKKRKFKEVKYSLSHQNNVMKKLREERSVPAELSTLFVPTKDGPRIIQQGPAPVNRSPMIEDLSTTKRDMTELHRSESREHPSNFIPLLCPYYAKDGSCRKRSSCFFYHLGNQESIHLLGVRQASIELFQQAGQESQMRGKYELKFGFYCKPVVCNYWRSSSCHWTSEECWYAHWISKAWETCYFFATADGCSNNRQETCRYLHFRAPYIPLADSPSERFSHTSNYVPRYQSTFSTNDDSRAVHPNKEIRQSDYVVSDGNDQEITPTSDGENVENDNLRANLPYQTDYNGLMETPIQLVMANGKTIRVTLKLPSKTAKSISGELFTLQCCVPESMVYEFFDVEDPTVYGDIQSREDNYQLDRLAEHLKRYKIGVIVSTPSVDFLITPAQKCSWTFLPSIIQNKSRWDMSSLQYHVYSKGILPPVEKYQAEIDWSDSILGNQLIDEGSNDSVVDYISSLFPLIGPWPYQFFSWPGKSELLPKEVHLIHCSGWGAERQLITLYFQAAGAKVYELYQDFRNQTKSGVIIFHQSFPVGKIRFIPGFSKILMKSYNIFQIGTSSETNEFELNHLFQTGNALLITPKLFEKDPKLATRIMLHIQHVNKKRQSASDWTWKLATREKMESVKHPLQNRNIIVNVDVDQRYLQSLLANAIEKKTDELRLLYQKQLEAYESLKQMSTENGSQDITPNIGGADGDDIVGIFSEWFVTQALAPRAFWRHNGVLPPTVCRRGIVVYDLSEEASIQSWEQKFQHVTYFTPDMYIKMFNVK